MRKTVGRFTSIMFALIMAITVIIVGGVEAHASDRYEVFLDDIIYIGQENELLLFDNKGSKEPEIISVTPSDKSVVGIKSKTVNGFKTYYAVGKKRGAAELVFKFKNGSGKRATYSQDVMVLPYPDWAKTLKVNGKSLNLKKNPYKISLKTGASKQKIQLVPEKGWSIDMIDANAYDGEGGYGVKQVKITKFMLKSGKAFKFPANKKYLSVTVFLTKDCSFSIEDGDETYDYDGEQLISYCVTFTRPSTFKVKYDLNGGKGVVPIQTKSKGKSLKLSTKKPTRTGYDFAGWSTKKNGKVVYKPGATYKTDSDITLYAVWNWHAYYIKFEKNGGKGSQYYQACRYGKTFNLPACKYTRTGYTFAGWNTKKNGSGKSYADKASFKNLTAVDKKTVSLYAQWEAKKYKIKYSGVPEGSNNPNRKTYTVNTSTFKLKDASNEGYDFKGWYSDSKKTKKITSVKKGGTGTKTIYSKWTPHKYIIVFNANGGTGTMESMKSRKYGETYTLTSNAFKKKDYVFTGWNTSADGKGRAFKNGATVKNLTPDHGGLVTLYAQWKLAFTPRTKLEGLLNSGCHKRAVELLGASYDIPNCTTYALARALEITHYNYNNSPNYTPPFIVGGHSNAENWWENNENSKNPYKTGNKPKRGAIAVWKGADDDPGHVAIVEHVSANGDVYYSHSSWGGFSYTPKYPYPGSVNDSKFHCETFKGEESTYIGSGRTLLGYIYLID